MPIGASKKSGQHPSCSDQVQQRHNDRETVQLVESLFVARVGGSVDGGHQDLARWRRRGRNPSQHGRREEVTRPDQDRSQRRHGHHKEIKMRESLADGESRDIDWQRCEQKCCEAKRKERHSTEQNSRGE